MDQTISTMQETLSSFGCVGTWEADYPSERVKTTGQLTSIYGLTLNQAERGASWLEIDHAFHPDDLDTIRRLRRLPFAGQGGSHVVRFRMVDPDGQVRWMEAHGRVAVGRDGFLTRTKGLVFETTTLTRAPDALPSAKATLAGLDHLSANLLQALRGARHLGLADVEAELRFTLARITFMLGRKERQQRLH